MKLLTITKALHLAGRHCDLAVAIESELSRLKGSKVPINADSALAAVISDLSFDWRLGNGFFILSRSPV